MKTTQLLYYSDQYMKDFDAEVLSASPVGENWDVILDRTCFYPEGGGQKGDRGFLGSGEVVDLYKKEGIVHHIVSKKPETGSRVACSIDWDRRFDYMQQHTGQHVVSGVLFKFGYGTVSVHQGEKYTTIETDASEIDTSTLEAVEEEVNKIISMNIRIKDYHVSEKEIPVLKLRRAPKVSGQIRIVEIEGYDKVACGGVHTSSTGDVMFAKILFTEKIRSHVRIAWLLGNRVLPDYRGKMFTVHSLAEIFSAKEDELVASAKKLLDENRTLKKELETLQLDSARKDMDHLFLEAELINGIPVVIKQFENMDGGYLKLLLSVLPGDEPYAVSLVNIQQNRLQWAIAVTSEGFDFNRNRGDLLISIRGKGGGKPPFYQGVGDNTGGIELFFSKFKDLLRKSIG